MTVEILQHSPKFATCGQLQIADIAEVAARGFTAIVNNRPDNEEGNQPRSADLASEADQFGLGYAYLPIEPGKMTDCDAREMGDILSAAKGPVLAFCRTGNRSQALWNRTAEIGQAPG